MYGQTEATARMAYLPPELAESHPDAIGVPIPGGSFRLEPRGRRARSPTPASSSTAARTSCSATPSSPPTCALGRTVDELRTGDLARRADDGLYEIVGRRSRFAKILGLRIDPQRVEATAGRARRRPPCCAGGDDELVVAVGRRRRRRARRYAGWWPTGCGLPAAAVRRPRCRRAAPAAQRQARLRGRPARWRRRAGHRRPCRQTGRTTCRALYARGPRPAPTSPTTAPSSAWAATRCPTWRCRPARAGARATCRPAGTRRPIRDLRPADRRPVAGWPRLRRAWRPGDQRRAARHRDRAHRRHARPAVRHLRRRAPAARRRPASTSPASTSPTRRARRARPRASCASIGRIAAAERRLDRRCVCLLTDDYALRQRLPAQLASSGRPRAAQRHFWFIEALVYILARSLLWPAGAPGGRPAGAAVPVRPADGASPRSGWSPATTCSPRRTTCARRRVGLLARSRSAGRPPGRPAVAAAARDGGRGGHRAGLLRRPRTARRSSWPGCSC